MVPKLMLLLSNNISLLVNKVVPVKSHKYREFRGETMSHIDI